jgi:hypothetical protein
VMGQIFSIIDLTALVSHIASCVFTDNGRWQQGLGNDYERRGRWRSTASDTGTPISGVVTDYLKCCCGARVWCQDRLQLCGYPLVNVMSSDIYDEDREKHDYVRSISRRNTTIFILVQALSESNSPTSSIAVLCCGKIGCPRCVTGCYLYNQRTAL